MQRRKSVPLIAPSVVQKAVRCIKKAAAGIEGLSESDLALNVVIQVVSVKAEVSLEVVADVLSKLALLPQLCLCEAPAEEADIEVEEITPPRGRRRARRAKKKRK